MRDLIKEWEGLRLTAYLDQGGVPTIGWGHTATVTMEDVKNKKTITIEEAERLYRMDKADAERFVTENVTVPLTPNQREAIVSFVFNVGVGNFKRSTLLRRLNAGDYGAVPEQLARWNKVRIKGELVVSDGLVRRRAAEAALWSRVSPATNVDEPVTPASAERSLATSRTMAGGAVAAVGTAASAAAEKLEPYLSMSDVLQWAFVALTLIGIGVVMYARVDDWRTGRA